MIWLRSLLKRTDSFGKLSVNPRSFCFGYCEAGHETSPCRHGIDSRKFGSRFHVSNRLFDFQAIRREQPTESRKDEMGSKNRNNLSLREEVKSLFRKVVTVNQSIFYRKSVIIDSCPYARLRLLDDPFHSYDQEIVPGAILADPDYTFFNLY